MTFANNFINKEGEDWSCAVATNNFYKKEDKQAPVARPRPALLRGRYKDYVATSNQEIYYKSVFSSEVLKELKEEREIYEWYCEECIWFGYGEEADYNTLFTSGIEEININHFNDMKCGDFNTIGCDNCI
tara:strand:+ start:732 stop:1121 length:390 start_codon:yes stop_codon:yes gene_type:complete